MNKIETIRAVAALSSGTVGGLFKTAKYEEIDGATAKWVEWINTQHDDKRWATWQDCWEEYKVFFGFTPWLNEVSDKLMAKSGGKTINRLSPTTIGIMRMWYYNDMTTEEAANEWIRRAQNDN